MLQGANTDIFNPSVPKAHNYECANLSFGPVHFLCKLSFKASLRIFILFTPGTVFNLENFAVKIQTWFISINKIKWSIQ